MKNTDQLFLIETQQMEFEDHTMYRSKDWEHVTDWRRQKSLFLSAYKYRLYIDVWGIVLPISNLI